ncbi:MAG: 5'-nucleotidase/UDP-sugar diphosphatase [Bradymonadia bacterium]|jgi:5'-nucleotidase/UDP-sugar diphosphatase
MMTGLCALSALVLGCEAEPAQLLPDRGGPRIDFGADALIAGEMGPADADVDMARDLGLDLGVDAQVEAECVFSDGQINRRLVLLHSNDGASALVAEGQSGGIARFVTLMRRLQAEARAAETPVLSLTTGDNVLAGPTFAASLERGPPYFDAIALSAAGFDAMAIGNHDFDFGPQIFANFVRSFDAAVEAYGDANEAMTAPVVLGANLRVDGEPAVSALKLDERLVQFTVIDGVGLIGVSTPEIEAISSPGEVSIDAPRGAIEAAVASLQADGVDVIVLVSHLRDAELEARLATEIDDIDVVIAGSSDDLLANPSNALHAGDVAVGEYPRVICGTDGRAVLLVSTGGQYRYIGRLAIEIDTVGRVVRVDPESGPRRVSGVGVDAVERDPFVEEVVNIPVRAALQTFADNEVALTTVELDGRRESLRAGETNLGDLIADALLWEAEEFVFGTDAPAPDIGLLNAGAIRNNSVFPPGSLTELDTFAMLPFASFVVQVPVTRAALKDLLENGVAQVASASGRFPHVAGVRFVWNPNGEARRVDQAGNVLAPGDRIVSAELLDGTPLIRSGVVVDGPLLHVATLDFLSRGGDGYPFATAGTGFGVSYQQALRDYVAGGLEGQITVDRYPVGGQGRIRREAQ